MPRRFRLSNDTQVCQRLMTSPEFKLGTEVAELKSSARLHSCGQKLCQRPLTANSAGVLTLMSVPREASLYSYVRLLPMNRPAKTFNRYT